MNFSVGWAKLRLPGIIENGESNIGTVLPSEIHHAQLLPDRVVVFMRDKDAFAMKVLAALRHQFGGHAVKRKEGP